MTLTELVRDFDRRMLAGQRPTPGYDNRIGKRRRSTWPKTSEALAVHPHQRQEAIEDAKKSGVPTHFKRNGQPVFESEGHLRRYCAAYGYANAS